MNNPTRRQHHVPQFYLKKFVDERGKIHVYQDNAHRTENTQNVAVQTEQYTVIGKDGKRYDQLEAIFSTSEGQAAKIHPKLERNEQLNSQETEDYSFFLALQFLRTPKFRKDYAQVYGDAIGKYAEMMANNGDFDEEGKRLFSERLVDIVVDERAALEEIPKLAPIYAYKILRKHWAIVRCPGQHFITSDHPIVINRLKKRHPVMPHVPASETYFALSPTACLVLTDIQLSDEKFIIVKKDWAKQLNKMQALNAHRQIFSHKSDSGISRLCEKCLDPNRRNVEVFGGTTLDVRTMRKLPRI